MHTHATAVIVFLASLSVMLFPSESFSAVALDAMAAHVEGEVNYVSKKDSKQYTLQVGIYLFEGDRVVTGADGRAEIKFATGAMLLLAENTDITIKTLQVKGNSFSAVFGLAMGLIKSSFNKLTAEDLVEYHTKSAIAGIAGTPNHIVKADLTSGGAERTNVYLLGQKGEEGSLYVRGFDPDVTEVTLFAGQGTTILAGLAPLAPFVLGPELLKSLGIYQFQAGGAAATTSAGSGSAAAAGGGSGGGMGIGTIAAIGAGGAAAVVAAGSSGGTDENIGNTTQPSTGDNNSPTIPDISGAWAGTWGASSCNNPNSTTSGTWAGTLSQNGGEASGPIADDGGTSWTWTAVYDESTEIWSVSWIGNPKPNGTGTIKGNTTSGTWASEKCQGSWSGSKQ